MHEQDVTMADHVYLSGYHYVLAPLEQEQRQGKAVQACTELAEMCFSGGADFTSAILAEISGFLRRALCICTVLAGLCGL